MGDILESLVGAIFIDSKGNLEEVWKCYTRLFPLPEIEKVISNKPKHPVKELMERFPSNVNFSNAKVLKDGTVTITVDIHMIYGPSKETLKFKGLGGNRAGAKYAAAKCALREFEKRAYRNIL